MHKCRKVVIYLTTVLIIGSAMVNASASGADLILRDGTISATITVGAYHIRQTAEGQEVDVEDFGFLLVPGKPKLPSKIFAIAIPPGAEVTQVTFNPSQGIVLPGTYQIPPSPLPRIIGKENPLVYEHDLKMYQDNYDLVYGGDEVYPASVGEFVRTAGFRKYNLVDVRIMPLAYHPRSGQLTYYSEVTVNIGYSFPKDFSKDDVMVDNLSRKEKVAQEIILNYREAQNWYPSVNGNKDSYDFVIITMPSLESSVAPLVNWEMLKGKTVNVVTTTWIDTNYTGYDLAEKIRNFLRDKYPSEQWGIENVLLVGDYDDLPMRRCWQDPAGDGKPETDYYYAELSLPDSISWDSNVNRRWGEDSDPIDFYAEVNVGRIPSSTPSTVQHICEKSVTYEANNDPAFRRNMLFLGAFFWSNTDNAVLMEAIINQSWMSDWTLTRMYEQGYSAYPSDYNLNYSSVLSVWSSGQYALVNWAGHGTPTSSRIYYSGGEAFVSTSTCPFLNDNNPAIVFADACSNSDTDYDINLGKKMMEQGTVGFLGGTKPVYGVPGWSNPNDGCSQSMDYYFTTRLTSQRCTQGEAHQWALTYMYTHDIWFQPKFETFEWGALWGNPDLGLAPVITNYPPETPIQPSGITEGLPDVEYQFLSTTTDPEGESLYYIFDWEDETNSGWLGPYASAETCVSSHIWISSGEYAVKVKAKDINDNHSDWSSSLSVAVYICGDCNGDGVVEVADVIFLVSYLYKSGSAPNPPKAGDVYCDDMVDLADVVYLINYLFKSGPAPFC